MHLNRLWGRLKGNIQEKHADRYCCLLSKFGQMCGMVSLNVDVVPEQQSSGSLRGIVSMYGAFSLVIPLAFLFVSEQLQGKQEFFLCCYIKVRSFVHL